MDIIKRIEMGDTMMTPNKKLQVQHPKEYTRWHQFLAWVGFITIISIVITAAVLVVFGNLYLSSHGI